MLSEVETDAGKPVVSAMQAFVWHMARKVGAKAKPQGHGKLLLI